MIVYLMFSIILMGMCTIMIIIITIKLINLAIHLEGWPKK